MFQSKALVAAHLLEALDFGEIDRTYCLQNSSLE